MFQLNSDGLFIFNGGKAGVVLIAMNDYLVNNIYLDIIIAPLTVKNLPDRSEMYVLLHGVIDLMCIVLLVVVLYPLVTIKKWKTKKKNILFEVFRHLLLPAGLLIGMNCMAPSFVIWLFAKNAWFVMVICSCLLFLGGVYKLGTAIRKEEIHR